MKVVRLLIGVVLGYIAIALMLMVGMTIGAFIMGPNRVFQGDSWNPSTLWNFFAMALAMLAALAGGAAAQWWGGKLAAGPGLAAVMVVMGSISILSSLDHTIDPNAPVRPAQMALADWARVGNYARPAHWNTAATTVLGAAGALLGARWMDRRRAAQQTKQ